MGAGQRRDALWKLLLKDYEACVRSCWYFAFRPCSRWWPATLSRDRLDRRGQLVLLVPLVPQALKDRPVSRVHKDRLDQVLVDIPMLVSLYA